MRTVRDVDPRESDAHRPHPVRMPREFFGVRVLGRDVFPYPPNSFAPCIVDIVKRDQSAHPARADVIVANGNVVVISVDERQIVLVAGRHGHVGEFFRGVHQHATNRESDRRPKFTNVRIEEIVDVDRFHALETEPGQVRGHYRHRRSRVRPDVQHVTHVLRPDRHETRGELTRNLPQPRVKDIAA